MKNKDYKKIMDLKNKKSRSKRNRVIANAAITGLMLTGAVVTPATLLLAPQAVEASIVNATLFESLLASNDSGTTFDSPYAIGAASPFSFTVKGIQLADADVLNGNRVAAVGIPTELSGLVTTDGTANLTLSSVLNLETVGSLNDLVTSILAIIEPLGNTVDNTLNQPLKEVIKGIPGLSGLVGLLLGDTALSDVLSVKINGNENIVAELTTQLNAVTDQLTHIAVTNQTINAEIEQGGTLLLADIDQGILTTVVERLNNVLNVVQGLSFDVAILPGAEGLLGPIIGGVLGDIVGLLLNPVNELISTVLDTALDGLVSPLITTIQGLLTNTGQLGNQILDASVLGEVIVTFPVTATTPTRANLIASGKSISGNVYTGGFEAVLAQRNAISVEIGNSIEANTEVFFQLEDAEQTDAPLVDPATEGDETIKGSAVPGATVTVNINGTDYTVVAAIDGSWEVTVPALNPDDTIYAFAQENGKDPSQNVDVTVIPLETSAAPIVDDANEGDTKISGTGTPGATITVTINGTDYTTVVAPDGTWEVTVPELAADDIASAKSEEAGKNQVKQ
ncbi:adhesive domain-containing protein [Enterococcus alcedinis]|uniref:adhesive domain-containing protein n=1 Tax=Enterococcus alcedinis TaxID=1274384 RepID=UPI00361CE64C